MKRNGGYIAREDKYQTSFKGIFDQHDQYLLVKSGKMDNVGILFAFSSFTFISPNEDPFAPSYSDITNQATYQAQTWASDTNFFNVTDGIQYFKIPQTATYRITCWGASGKNARIAANRGYGGIVRGDFSLSKDQWIGMMIGQRPPTSSATNRAWQGGGGGTFVVTSTGSSSGSNVNATPLLVASGGGQARESAASSRANCDANMSPDGKAGSGRSGGTAGTESPGGGHNATGGGGAAGWSGEGDAHGDTRNLYSPTGYPAGTASQRYLTSRGFNYNGTGPGRGGLFNTGYDTSYRGSGGFGAGGPGGWGGEGPGGGYSGGGNGNNSSTAYSGGGGSFISSSATNVGTSTGAWDAGSGYFSGHNGLGTSSGYTNLGYNTNANGQVIIEKQ